MVEKVDGAASAMILGADGIPVEEYSSLKLLSMEDLGAESSQMIKDINLASENLGIGTAREFALISDACGIIMRRINPEYYLAMIIAPEGNYGKARFVLKTYLTKIEEEF